MSKSDGHGERAIIISTIISRLGITEADIKRITPTHVETWNWRTIPHNLTVVKETIEL